MRHVPARLHRMLSIAPLLLVTTAPAQFVESVDTIFDWQGEAANDLFGLRNRVIGDFTGDGVPELGVSAPLNAEGGTDAGKVYLYDGASGALIRTHTGLLFDYFGLSFDGVGDVDGDGAGDYAIGAPETINFQDTFGRGYVVLYSGANGAPLKTWSGENFGAGFGGKVAGAGSSIDGPGGDINGDGTPDVIIGAPVQGGPPPFGRAYVYSGADYALVHAVDGEGPIDLFGLAVGGLGDLTGDGQNEFIIGAPNAGAANHGRAYVYDGATGAQLPFSPLEGDKTSINFGILMVSGPGDVNDDGTLDIYVGDPLDNENGAVAGKAYVFSGVDGSVIHNIPGAAADDAFGIGRGAGDVNFDGIPDLIISGPGSSVGAASAGQTQVISGLDGSILRTITSTLAGDTFGTSTVAVGDIDADGAIDFMVSADEHDGVGPDSGRVWVIKGNIFPGVTGDVDGDGDVDFADLLALLAAWGPCGGCPEDIDGDGAVTFADVLLVLANWT